MTLKRLCVAFFLLGFGLLVAGTAQAVNVQFSLVGGGGQIHIGNGLALPIQQAAKSSVTTGTVLPPLGVPVKAGPAPLIAGTIVKPLISTAGKKGYQRKLIVPTGVLSKAAGLTTVGVKFSNTALWAVGTNLKYTWPAASAVFSTGAAAGGGGTGSHVIAAHGGTMTYSNKLGKRFGGPAHFRLAGGAPSGDFPQAPITIWLVLNTAMLPCTHSAPVFGGPAKIPGQTCIAGVVLANPTGLAGQGGFSATSVSTTGALAPTNVAIAKIGALPVSGTLLPGLAFPATVKPYPIPVATNTAIPAANDAISRPGPWTTGQVIISNPAANAGTEKFTLSGKDSRTSHGGGTIQMVSGSLSTRLATGPNANRGWIRLVLASPLPVPSMSIVGLAATAGLLLLTAGYAMRRRIFA